MTPKQVRDRLAVLRTMLEEEFPTTRVLDKRSIAFDFAAGLMRHSTAAAKAVERVITAEVAAAGELIVGGSVDT